MPAKLRKPWKAIAAFCVVAAVGWFVWNREATKWFDTVPIRFTGSWVLGKDENDDDRRIRSIAITPYTIVLRYGSADDGQAKFVTYSVRKVSLTFRPGGDAERMVIIFGPPANDASEQRLEFSYGQKQNVLVREIAPNEDREDHWFDVGEFVKTN